MRVIPELIKWSGSLMINGLMAIAGMALQGGATGNRASLSTKPTVEAATPEDPQPQPSVEELRDADQVLHQLKATMDQRNAEAAASRQEAIAVDTETGAPPPASAPEALADNLGTPPPGGGGKVLYSSTISPTVPPLAKPPLPETAALANQPIPGRAAGDKERDGLRAPSYILPDPDPKLIHLLLTKGLALVVIKSGHDRSLELFRYDGRVVVPVEPGDAERYKNFAQTNGAGQRKHEVGGLGTHRHVRVRGAD